MAVTELVRVVITVADLDAMVSFYRDGLGLDVGPAQAESDPAWTVLLGLDAGTTARVAAVRFGAEMLALAAFDPPGARYPVPCASNDQWFQHVALVAGDIGAVWNRLEQAKPEAITEGPPVLLPPNTGSVTAFKFRDPEGHPFELISFPEGVGDPRWQRKSPGIRGFDHTAISVLDLERSLAFYTGLLGFHVGERSLNAGPEQDRLDGLAETQADVVPLQPVAASTPHVELLHYRTPPGRPLAVEIKANDVAAALQVHRVDDLPGLVEKLQAAQVLFVSPGIVSLRDKGKAAAVRDPDGHIVLLLA
ncbi:MAG: VOC family protein [Alphaproteobacteria bacterium]